MYQILQDDLWRFGIYINKYLDPYRYFEKEDHKSCYALARLKFIFLFRKSAEEKKKVEEEHKRREAKQRERARKLQRLIATRAEANDPHQSLAKMLNSKLKLFRYSAIYPLISDPLDTGSLV